MSVRGAVPTAAPFMVAHSSAIGVERLAAEVRDATNNEAHGAKNNERHVCARRRDGEPAVS